jgi:hypothetical protein
MCVAAMGGFPHTRLGSFPSFLEPPQVNAAKVPYLASWAPNKGMHGLLAELKTLMARASKAQPPEMAPW